jgi:hypothetical protein
MIPTGERRRIRRQKFPCVKIHTTNSVWTVLKLETGDSLLDLLSYHHRYFVGICYVSCHSGIWRLAKVNNAESR